MSAKFLLIIPAYNEAENIERVLQTVRAELPQVSILVIDDGSADETFSKAERFGATVRLPANLGIGGAVQTGFKAALREGFDFCIQVDGDGQHPASEVKKLIAQVVAQPDSDILIGSRYVRRDGFQSTRLRRFGSWILSKIIKTLFKNQVTDPTSGLRLYSKRAIKLFSVEYPVEFPEPVSLALALSKGLKVNEIAVNMAERLHGQSSINGIKPVIYMLRVSFQICFVKFRSLIT